MWETFISWYINSYLGQYVENLNSQQLSFALRQGELELENVPLKKNIFRSWGLPIEVRSGVVGRIKIEFNIFKYFKNEPVLVTIEDVYLVAGPLVLSEWDPVEEEILSRESKMSGLDSHEARWKANNDLRASSGSYYSLYFSSMRIGASIVTKVIENLQLNVRNVHIRFEEDIPGDSKNRVLAFGVTLEGVTAQSCDSKWNPLSTSTTGGVGDSTECSYKTLQLNKFAVYCDTKAEKFSGCSPQELKVKVQNCRGTHNFILCPVSAEARISKNNSSNPLSSSAKPRFDIQLTLDKVPLQLADSQFRQLYAAIKAFRKLQRNCRLRHYRPYCSIEQNRKDWWRYALKAILLARGYKSKKRLTTWEEVLDRGKKNVLYVNAYEKHLLGELLPFDVRRIKDAVEEELHYDEIIILRECAMDRIDRINARGCGDTKSKSTPTSPVKDAGESESARSYSVVGWMFPSWWGWVSTNEAVDEADHNSLPGSPVSETGSFMLRNRSIESLNDSKLMQSQTEIDEAILDDVKAFGRDTILARVNFVLKQGGVTLKKRTGPLLDFEFSDLDFRMELRPRSGAHRFELTLKSVLLRDFSTKSLVVAPHNTAGLKYGSPFPRASKEPVFKVRYERKPLPKTVHRIIVVTKPLDLVLYPVLLEDVTRYFAVDPKENADDLDSPYSSYEAVKQKTKEEINAYWMKLLNQRESSAFGGSSSAWEIVMSISAPQIIIHGAKETRGNLKKLYAPEEDALQRKPAASASSRQKERTEKSVSFEPFLVVDLGRFRFTNLPDDVSVDSFIGMTSTGETLWKSATGNSDITNFRNQEEQAYSDDEQFLTPCSSPAPEATSPSDPNSPRPSISDASDAPTIKSPDGNDLHDGLGDLQSKLYKHYRLEITDVQILVVEGKLAKEGQWKTAVLRGSSPLHLLDKFSINLQMERRLIYCENPSWPALTLDGTLPKWNLHLNEGKLLTVRTVLHSFLTKVNTADLDESEHFKASRLSGSQISLQDEGPTHTNLKSDQREEKDDTTGRAEDSKLFVARFTVQQVNVEIQHLGRSIAELQIIGAKTTLVMRPIDTTVSFVLQSLLLADGIQTFGQDFELLLASHKHVSMDSVSGSLRDSEPTSPASPQSPVCTSPPPYNRYPNQLPVPSQLHQALVSTLQSSNRSFKRVQSNPLMDNRTPHVESDALITADLVVVHNDVAILNIQCNNLDVIANQETIMEIIQFLRKAFPNDSSVQEPVSGTSTTSNLVTSIRYKVQASFEFHKLNMLLVRGVIGKEGNQCARKIATATASNAKVNFSKRDGNVVVEGSLGGLQVLNLTREGAYHQRVLSVGQDPLVDESYRVIAHDELRFAEDVLLGDTSAALTFCYERPEETGSILCPTLSLRMASVIYTHSPVFLVDLKKCISEFQAPLATQLRSAAAQIALGFVHPDPGLPAAPYRSPYGSLSGSLDQLNVTDEDSPSMENPTGDADSAVKKIAVELDIVLDSPVIVLPRNPCSPEVLVANLGQITVSGCKKEEYRAENPDDPDFVPPRSSTPDSPVQKDVYKHSGSLMYQILICDISLYTLDLTHKWNMLENLKVTFPGCSSTSVMKAKELYHCDVSSSSAILHNTVVQLNIRYRNESYYVDAHDDPILFPTDHADGYNDDDGGPCLSFTGRVVNPLKVSLTPKQYSQLLDSLGNIALGDEDSLFDELIVKDDMSDLKARWRAEAFNASAPDKRTRKAENPLPLPSPTKSGNDGMPIFVSFEVPELIADLVLPGRAEVTLSHNDCSPLRLSCAELGIRCNKSDYVMEILLSLKSLTLEDTMEPLESEVRFMAQSSIKLIEEDAQRKVKDPMAESIDGSSIAPSSRYVSSSCPDIQKSVPISIDGAIQKSSWQPSSPGVRPESSSLPNHLDARDIFASRFMRGVSRSFGASKRRASLCFETGEQEVNLNNLFYPATPPPSPRAGGRTDNIVEQCDNLVQITMKFVDPRSPQFFSRYKGTHRFINVDFNTLETTLYPRSFIPLRKFFAEVNESTSLAAKRSSKELSKSKVLHTATEKEGIDHKNSETSISVQALGIKFVNCKGFLARGEISNVSCNIVGRGEEFFGVDGRLGSLQIRDISPFVGKYPMKFTFQGRQALDFDYSQTGPEAKFRLQMSSVVCVHTNRFYVEFSSMLSDLFGSLNRDGSKDWLETSTTLDSALAKNKPPVRIALDIQAGAPVLLFPYSSTSRQLLVADLGHLSVKNKIMPDSKRSVVDLISVDLIEMDLFSTELQYNTKGLTKLSHENVGEDILKIWILDRKNSIVKTSHNASFLKEKCALKLKVRRLLGVAAPDDALANMSIEGTLTTVCCILDLDKYKLIRGLLEYNIGEHLETADFKNAANVIRNHGETYRKRDRGESPIGNGPSGGLSVRKDLAIELNLVNVTLELTNLDGTPLSRVDFIKSKFSFYNNSDGTKDVDLASQEILICDTRLSSTGIAGEAKNCKNAFPNILQQSSTSCSALSGSSQGSFAGGTSLQAEIHYRMTGKGTSATIVLNNMRLMLILDWWMELQAFLSQKGPTPKPVNSLVHAVSEKLYQQLNKAGHRESPLRKRIVHSAAPVSVSAGIVTKRAPVIDLPATTFELKLNVSNCELVLVEDASIWDSNAIILKSTAVLNYKPHLERPITCTLLQCELFSCILGLEAETALSILDPTIINLEVVRKTKVEPQGILDAALVPSTSERILKIQSAQLYLRLSYHDMKMFFKFLEKFSKQAHHHLTNQPSYETSGEEKVPQHEVTLADSSILKLELMGFDRDASIRALTACNGQVDAAAIYLTDSKKVPLPSSEVSEQEETESNISSTDADQKAANYSLSEVDLRFTTLSLCVIDDCKDADVPLLELSVTQVEMIQNYMNNSGQIECYIGIDFYNRVLSGWEPVLEPWKCAVAWKKNVIGELGEYIPGSEFPSKAPELDLIISSRQVMNVNISSTLLSLYKTVASNWSEDYDHQKVDRRRSPFVPYILRNETGSQLWFTTIVPNNEDLLRQQRSLSFGAADWNTLRGKSEDKTSWISVSNGSSHSFSFEGRGKLRHRNTHSLKNHQLVVQVDGWDEVVPVSVDKIGNYFRIVKPKRLTNDQRYGNSQDLPPARLVFEVTLMGSAQKLITVRSALRLKNCLDEHIELKLENTIVYPAFAKEQTGGSFLAYVRSGETYPVPLHSIWAQLWVRPLLKSSPTQSSKHGLSPVSKYRYSSAHLLASTDERMKSCVAIVESNSEPYRFCVSVQKDEFPADEDDLYQSQRGGSPMTQYLSLSKKANLITLVSPLVIVNLLPVELTYEIRGKAFSGTVLGLVAGGKESRFTHVNTSETVEISFQVENFPYGGVISFSCNTTGFNTKLRVMDAQKRPLILSVRIVKGEGNNVAVYISCPFWIVNKTGIPIVCKQDSTNEEAAGQSFDYEVARNLAPLLFSFSDLDGASALSLRVGSKLHGENSKPLWSRSFYLQNGIHVRKLHVSVPTPKSEIIYMVGTEVKTGRGRYRDSRLVTIAPRFVLDNRSKWKIEVSQKCFVSSYADPCADSTHVTLPQGCNVPFHWPKLDKDQLLCVRLAEPNGCPWSGGFSVDTVDSFHIPVRDRDGNCKFLRVEVVLQGPTYFIVLGDTEKLPPPFRVDNLSFVPIIFHQTAVGDEKAKLTAKSESSTPFAWDEPTLPSNLTVSAPGGTSVVISMDNLGLASHLTYENFFYITFTATFPGEEIRGQTVGVEALNLVFDVVGTKVILMPKEPGKRVNADGLIEHEGSSPPREPRKPAPVGSVMVLDIAGSGPQPTQYTPLMLRRPDSRRACTQHWTFTEDGRLKLEKLESLYVQAKDGFRVGSESPDQKEGSNTSSWSKWSDVVLGPDHPICYSRTETGIPAEQAVSKQKLRPGSGRLALKVDTDGPTRVLRIVDVEKPPRNKRLQYEIEEHPYNTIPKIVASVNLKGGLGVSIISCRPREELIYLKLTALNVKYSDSKESEYVEVIVEDFQIDNQLLEAEVLVPVFVIPTSRELDPYGPPMLPSLHLSWVRMKSNLNAHVFKSWELGIKPLSITIEEKLLLKLCNWLGLSSRAEFTEGLQESDFEVQKALTNATSLTAKRFYFGHLSIELNHVRLSVVTSAKLSNDLSLVKRRLGLTLIRFEDAHVELDAFIKQHPFETFEFLFASLIKHYRDELVSRAAIILGSTDFLGNPLGFVNDVTVGFSGLIYEGSVGSLVKNVTHGISNSAAKVTGTLGDGLGRTTMDDRYEEERRRLREGISGSSTEHLKAGFMGLYYGLTGGFTSLLTHPIEGALSDGLPGFVAGLGKGIVGTVAKPAVGVLDFAAGAANAIRDSSRSSFRTAPERARPRRVAAGAGGLLPLYSDMASRGQELLYEVNGRNYEELYIGYETLMSGPGKDLKILLSSQNIYVYKPSKPREIMLKVHLSELIESRVVNVRQGGSEQVCVELVRLIPGAGGQREQYSPQVKCDSESMAHRIVQQINYAKVLFEETRHSQLEKSESPVEY